MWLPSRLERSTLGDLLGGLHRASVSGTLELVEVDGSAAGARRGIHLRSGRVVGVDGAGARIGELVASAGAARWQVESALAGDGDSPGQRLEERSGQQSGQETGRASVELAGERLVRRGIADVARLRAALLAQAVERLDGLFRLRRAEVRFRVTRPSPPSGIPVELGPDAFLHGRPRRTPRDGAFPPAPPAGLARALASMGFDATQRPSTEDLRRAFRQRAARLHPDRARDATARRILERALADLTASYHVVLAAVG